MTWSSHSWSGLRPAMSIGSVMFSSAFSVGSRLNAWKMKPIRSRRSWVSFLSLSPVISVLAEAHLARGDGVEPGEAVHQRGLAGARRAHDRGELAAGDVHVDVVEGDDAGLPGAVRLRRPGAAGAATAVRLQCPRAWEWSQPMSRCFSSLDALLALAWYRHGSPRRTAKTRRIGWTRTMGQDSVSLVGVAPPRCEADHEPPPCPTTLRMPPTGFVIRRYEPAAPRK